MKRKTMKTKLMTIALALVLALTAIVPTQVEAAGKAKIQTSVKKTRGVKLSSSTMTFHTKKTVPLNVKYNGKNVTSKAKYSFGNKKVAKITKNGKLTAKKNGTTVLTIKYKGKTKKIKIHVGNHKWKAHRKTVTIECYHTRCACGKDLGSLLEKKYCTKCCGPRGVPNGWCKCKMHKHMINHIYNNEPDNYWPETLYRKVTYTDYYYCNCGTKKAGEKQPTYCDTCYKRFGTRYRDE